MIPALSIRPLPADVVWLPGEPLVGLREANRQYQGLQRRSRSPPISSPLGDGRFLTSRRLSGRGMRQRISSWAACGRPSLLPSFYLLDTRRSDLFTSRGRRFAHVMGPLTIIAVSILTVIVSHLTAIRRPTTPRTGSWEVRTLGRGFR